jgi:uncharacterized protein with HEPN domain
VPSKEWSGRDLRQRARDTLDAIEAIRTYVKGLKEKQYLSDRKTQSAVERELLTIAEACGKMLEIDETLESRFPSVPWRKIRGMGNWIRHEYGRIDPSIVWNTITSGDLDALTAAVKAI